MTSADAKAFLVQHFRTHGILTQPQDWKRVSKRNDDQGRAVREFSHPDRSATVFVLEEAGGFALLDGPTTQAPTSQDPSTEGFTRTTFPAHQVEAAERIRKAYLHAAEFPSEDEDEEEEEPYDVMVRHPDYAIAFPALGSQLAFYFPEDTYDNEGLSGNMALDAPVGPLVVSILDPDPDAEDDLYLNTLLVDHRETIGLQSMDEYNFQFSNQTQTLRQAIQSLFDAGLSYDTHRACYLDSGLKRRPHYRGEGCLFRQSLGRLLAHPNEGPYTGDANGPTPADPHAAFNTKLWQAMTDLWNNPTLGPEERHQKATELAQTLLEGPPGSPPKPSSF